MDNSLFKMNVMTVLKDFESNKISNFVYVVECSNLWHDRLGHVNYNSLHKMLKLELLPSMKIDPKDKCETCVEAKMSKLSFPSVERITKPLDLIHSDLCDFFAI